MKKELLVLIFLSTISCLKKSKVIIQQNDDSIIKSTDANSKVADTSSVNAKSAAHSVTPKSELNLTFDLIPNQSIFVNAARKVSFTIRNAKEDFDCERNLKASSSDFNLVPVSHIIFSGKGRLCLVEIKPLPEKSGSTTLTFELLQNNTQINFLLEVTQKVPDTNTVILEKPKPSSFPQQDFKIFIRANKAQKDNQEALPTSNILSSAKNEQLLFKNLKPLPGEPKPATQNGFKEFLRPAEDLKK